MQVTYATRRGMKALHNAPQQGHCQHKAAAAATDCHCPCPTHGISVLASSPLFLSCRLSWASLGIVVCLSTRRQARQRRQLEPFIKAPHANCANPFKGKAGSRRSTRFSHQHPNAAAVPPSLSRSCSLSARLNTQTVDEATCLENNLKAQKVSKATRIGTYPLPRSLFYSCPLHLCLA